MPSNTNTRPPVRKNVVPNPKARPDIHGRTERDLKHGERLEFISKDNLHFISQYATATPGQPRTFPVAGRFYKGGLSSRMLVTFPHPIQQMGMFLGLVTSEHSATPVAVIDTGITGGHGILNVDPDLLRILPMAEADRIVGVGLRNQGKRIQRAMRDCGASLGYEDIVLARILTIAKLDLTFLRQMETAQKRIGFNLSGVPKMAIESSKVAALVSVDPFELPATEFVGGRCFRLLEQFGLLASNAYYGMYDILNAFVVNRKRAMELCPELLSQFDHMNKREAL